MLKVKSIGSNQTELSVGDNLILFSYQTPVAAWVPGRGWLRTKQKYSKTTSKLINKWLGGIGIEVEQSEINSILS